MPSAIKEMMVAELADRLRDISDTVLVDFTGLTAGKADALRARLGERGARMLVAKTSLAVRALRQSGLAEAADLVDGPTAFVYGGDDPVALSKMLLEWAKAEGGLKAIGAVVEGRAMDARGVAALAALPPVAVLHGLVVGAIAWPLIGFVGALQGVLRSFVTVVKAIGEKEEGQG